MLNLNYNIIGSIKQEYKGPVSFTVRNDPFSSSIVLALPGSVFNDYANQNAFGMPSAFADISAYVRAGVGLPPSGSNLQTYISKSSDGVAFPTSSLVKFTSPSERYSTSLYFNSTSSLVVNQLWPAYQGGNLSYASSFTIEAWLAFETTASAFNAPPFQPPFKPFRPFVYKYDPGEPLSGSYLSYAPWGYYDGNVSGSLAWILDSPDGSESQVNGTGSLPVVPYQWNHYAISYSNNVSNPFYNRKVKLYINGLKIAENSVPVGKEINQDLTEYLQLFGALDNPDLYGSSPTYVQDFRMYNGTDKNYTASLIPLPQSIVTWPI